MSLPLRAAGTEPTDVLKQAIQLVENGALSKQDAILQITPDLLNRLLASFFSAREVQQAVRAKRLLLKGVGCGTDVATGFVALDAAAAFRLHCRGKPVILVGERLSYLERDVLPLIQGFVVKEGPIAAALHWEKPGLVSAGYEALTEGMEVSLDPLAGFVIEGSLELHPGRVTSELLALLEWADEFKSLEIRTNASFPEEIATALAMGASGVGLCRIESIILQPNRLGLFSQVLKECVHGATNSDLLRALEQEIAQELLLLFQAVGPGKPFTIRLLDAPIAQLLRFWRDSEYVAKDYFDHLLQGWLQELNPMGGLRFGRLSLLFPDLLSFQLRAILKAFKAQPVRLQIMMPGVTDASEVMLLRREVEALAGALEVAVPMVGSMLETPRACLTIDRLVRVGDFFSFGTGDLTELVCGISRYDAPLSFLAEYRQKGIVQSDPFQVLDQLGVGALMRQTVETARRERPAVELGTCGAQAIEASSMAFCIDLGLDYVSVPMHQVLVARLTAAQARLKAL